MFRFDIGAQPSINQMGKPTIKIVIFPTTIAMFGVHNDWLVVGPPLWKILVNWDDEIPNIWEIKNVPNHQPAMIYRTHPYPILLLLVVSARQTPTSGSTKIPWKHAAMTCWSVDQQVHLQASRRNITRMSGLGACIHSQWQSRISPSWLVRRFPHH